MFPTLIDCALLSSFSSATCLRHVSQADLVRMIPQMHVGPRDVCLMELRFIQLLQFNLFVPTAVEFAQCLVAKLTAHAMVFTTETALSAAAARGDRGGGGGGGDPAAAAEQLRLDNVPARAARYLEYLELEFKNIEYRQSEKALAAVTCAIAHWSYS